MNQSERLNRLEENAFFQEEKLRALDEQLIAQHGVIEALEREITALKRQIGQMRDAFASIPGADRIKNDEPPPHYHNMEWRK